MDLEDLQDLAVQEDLAVAVDQVVKEDLVVQEVQEDLVDLAVILGKVVFMV